MPPPVAEEDQDLLRNGLINENSELTPQGSDLLNNAEQSGEDPDEMLDFFLKGWIDTGLNLTPDGAIWEGVMERGLQDILDEPNRAKGAQMYMRARDNGALDWWKDQTGEDYEDTAEFVAHAAKNFLPMAGSLFGELAKVPGGLYKAFEVAERSKPWYAQTPAGWILGAVKGPPTQEELDRVKVGVDAYAKEALIRMPATMSHGAAAALTHGPGTKHLFSDEDRALTAYLYRKAQHDIEKIETGVAIASAADFAATTAVAVADKATLGLVSEELDELIEEERENNFYGQSGVRDTVKTAEQQLDELDRAEGIDPDVPFYLRPAQQQTRAEKAKGTGTAVGMILSPDTAATLGYAMLPKAGLTMSMRKALTLTDELLALRGKRELLQASQKAAAASPYGKQAATGLQRQIDNIDENLRLTQKRLERVQQSVEPKALAALGQVGRNLRSVPLQVAGNTLEATGKVLQRFNPAMSAATQGAALFALTGGNPFYGALGVLTGMTGKSSKVLAFGQQVSRLGAEWTKRRTAIPYFRKLAEESTDSAFRRNLFLAGEMAISRPIRATRNFANLYRRAFIAEVPFSYIAAGGASYAGGNWLTDAMAEALGFEAPMGLTGQLMGSVMGMKTAGTVEEQNRLAMNAALNFRDEFLRDPDKRKAFDNLSPVSKKALGNYHTAFPDVHWDFDVTVENGSSYYDEDSNTIRINPSDPRGAEVAMAHEFRHFLDSQGFQQSVVEELIGPTGILTVGDGKGGRTLMPTFVTWSENENRLRGNKWDLSREDSADWADAALEWAAYSSMDGIARSVRHNALIEAAKKHPWMRSLFDAIMPASFRQKSLMNMGLLFEPDGTVAVRKGLPGKDAYKDQSAVAKRIQKYMRDRAGIGMTDADRADLTDPESKKRDPNAILPNDKEGLNQVETTLTTDLEHDADGNVIYKNGEAQIISQETATARAGEGQPLFGPQLEAEINTELPKVNVGRGTDNGTDLTGAAKMQGPVQADQLTGAAKLKELLRSLPYSDYQMTMIDEIIDILTNPDRAGESVLSLYFPAWRKKRAKGNWRNFVPKKGIAGKWTKWAPYALVQSDVGNLLVYGISHDQVAENIATLAKSAAGRKLYDGNAGRIAADFELMVKNWGKDIKNITQFTDEQLNFLNAIFGNLGKGNPDFNPALLEAPFKKLRPAVRSFRLDRINRLQTLPRDPFPFALEKGKRRELPFGEQAMEGEKGTSLTVYHGGTLDADRHGGLLFTSADRRQAEAYAEEEGAPVSQFTIDPATIATEEQAFQVMEELGIVPLDPNLAGAVGRREGMLQEYLDNDPVFDYRIGAEQRRKFVAEMKSRGFTGVKSTGVNAVTTTDTNVQEYILFEVPATQDASRPTTPIVEPGQRREMPLEQPDFYGMRSPTVEKLSEKVQGKRASADQLRALISAKKGLVNQEEVKWLMVEDLIDRLARQHNGKVPVAEFFEELRERGNQLIQEVEFREFFPEGEITPEQWQLDERKLEIGTSGGDAVAQVIDEHLAEESVGVIAANQRKRVPGRHIDVFEHQEIGTPMYGYVEDLTDGDTAYRLLIHTIHGVRVPHGSKTFRDVHEGRSWLERFVEKRLETRLRQENPKPLYGRYTLNGGVDYKERLLVVGQGRNIRYADSAREYSSNHFTSAQLGRKTKGYVAHSRQKTRKAEDGTTGTFLEEVQSDRHQKGQREGYAELLSEDEKLKLKRDLRQTQIEIEKNSNAYRVEKNRGRVSDEQFAKFEENHNRLRRQQNELEKKLANTEIGVPDAPYRDSNAWILALFKRALKDAVDQNHDWVGWTDGDTQNERYDINLADTFSFIRWDGDMLYAENNEGGQIDESVSRDELADYVGQDLAVRLQNDYDASEQRFDNLVTENTEELIKEYSKEENLGERPEAPATPMSEQEALNLRSAQNEWDLKEDEIRERAYEEAVEDAYNTGGGAEGVLEGDELEDNSEGDPEPFRRMYDRQIPNVVNKYLKKHKVKANPDELIDGQNFWRVDISDAMRTDIQENGQPRF